MTVQLAGEDVSVIENRAATVARTFLDRCEKTPDREAYRYPVGERWESVSWRQTEQRVRRLAAGLVALGVEPEQRVAIASTTRYEWILADLAIMCVGAATTTVYPSTIAAEAVYIVRDSESRVVFAEDEDQVAKLRGHRSQLPDLQTVVVLDGKPDEDWVISLAELERRGAELLDHLPEVVDDRVAGTQPDSLATLIYTSGTTGQPKGVRLPHSCWTYEGAAVAAMNILDIDDLQYLWLPMAHSFGKVLLTLQLEIGFPTAVDGRVDKIIENLAVVQPTFMGAAPRIFEKAYARITTMATSEGGAKAKIFDRAFTVGLAVSRAQRQGRKIPAVLAAQHKLFDRLVFAKIRHRFGGRVRFFISGAAALNADIAEWFHAAGILILEGYGLTESSAGSCVNRPTGFRFGTVGPPLPGTEVKVAGDGELLINGPGVMDGYHGDREASAAVLTEDGWLRTGDIGEIDADGFVRVTDRKKDLFKTSGGKYVAPQSIEAQFKALCPYTSQIVVHGQDRSFCVAIITLDADAIGQWAERTGAPGASYEQLVTSQPVRQLVQQHVDQLNDRLNRWEQIRAFEILDHDLSVDSGELTPSLKVKRKVVEDNYHEQLDRLYA